MTLSAATTVPVTVGYATGDGTATAGSDYTAVTSSVTIAAGQTSGTMWWRSWATRWWNRMRRSR